MNVYLGFSLARDARYVAHQDDHDGIVNTDSLDAAGLPWKWKDDGEDGPTFAGPGWLPTISEVLPWDADYEGTVADVRTRFGDDGVRRAIAARIAFARQTRTG